MIYLNNELKKVSSVALTGHIRPDGDCTGSTFGIYNYILDNFPDIEAEVYLQQPGKDMAHIPNVEKVVTEYKGEKEYDLLIVCDCGDEKRFEPFNMLLEKSKRVICIDHHVNNTGFADESYIIEDFSSTCELVYNTLDDSMISKNTAICLYTGIVTDTGGFKYEATTVDTHRVAGMLMKKGIPYTKIMDEGLSKRTFKQNKVIGLALTRSVLLCDEKIITSYMTYEEMQEISIVGRDMGVVIEQLRCTDSVEVAFFLYATAPDEYKISMRAKDYVDVSKICQNHEGGGHVKAAGCQMKGKPEDIINTIVAEIKLQLK